MFGWFNKDNTPKEDVKRELTDVQVADVWSLVDPSSSSPFAPPSISELENSYQESGVVFACINEIAKIVVKASIVASVAITTLLERPSTNQNFSQFISRFIADYLTVGAAYALKYPLNSAFTQELHVLSPSDMQIELGSFDKPFKRIRFDDGRNKYDLQPENLIMLVNGDATDPDSALKAVWNDVKVDIMRQHYQTETLKRLPYLVGVIETDVDTSKKQRDELCRSIENIVGSNILVLPRGAKMSAPGIVDSFAMPEVAASSESRISAALNVPAVTVGLKVGLDRSTYSNYQEARKSLINETVEPLLNQLSDAFTRGFGEDVEFMLDEDDIMDGSEGSDASPTQNEEDLEEEIDVTE